MNQDKESMAKIFKSFSDPNRLLVLELLQSGEKCACVLQENLKIGQSTLSHHMKILCDANIVNSRKEGKWTHYSLSEKGIKNAMELLGNITSCRQSQNLEGSALNHPQGTRPLTHTEKSSKP